MTSTEVNVAERIADELARIGKAAPTFRLEQFGISAKAIRGFVRDGHIKEASARENLIAAAVRAGMDARDAADSIEWNWYGRAAAIRTGGTPAYVQIVGRSERVPVDVVTDASALVEGFDAERTIEFATSLNCAAHGLGCLADHLRDVDTRKPMQRLSTLLRDEPYAGDVAVRDHLAVIKADLDSALARFRAGDRCVVADHLALAVARIVQVADDLGLDVGVALGRVVPHAKPA